MINDTIIEKLRSMGISTSPIIKGLQDGRQDATTAPYHILMREHVTDAMAGLFESAKHAREVPASSRIQRPRVASGILNAPPLSNAGLTTPSPLAMARTNRRRACSNAEICFKQDPAVQEARARLMSLNKNAEKPLVRPRLVHPSIVGSPLVRRTVW